MDSIKTKTKQYVKDSGDKCIAQVMAVPEKGAFRLYVAWEWEDMAKQGVFGICKSGFLFTSITDKAIDTTARFGTDITRTSEAKQIFKNLF